MRVVFQMASWVGWALNGVSPAEAQGEGRHGALRGELSIVEWWGDTVVGGKAGRTERQYRWNTLISLLLARSLPHTSAFKRRLVQCSILIRMLPSSIFEDLVHFFRTHLKYPPRLPLPFSLLFNKTKRLLKIVKFNRCGLGVLISPSEYRLHSVSE